MKVNAPLLLMTVLYWTCFGLMCMTLFAGIWHTTFPPSWAWYEGFDMMRNLVGLALSFVGFLLFLGLATSIKEAEDKQAGKDE